MRYVLLAGLCYIVLLAIAIAGAPTTTSGMIGKTANGEPLYLSKVVQPAPCACVGTAGCPCQVEPKPTYPSVNAAAMTKSPDQLDSTPKVEVAALQPANVGAADRFREMRQQRIKPFQKLKKGFKKAASGAVDALGHTSLGYNLVKLVGSTAHMALGNLNTLFAVPHCLLNMFFLHYEKFKEADQCQLPVDRDDPSKRTDIPMSELVGLNVSFRFLFSEQLDSAKFGVNMLPDGMDQACKYLMAAMDMFETAAREGTDDCTDSTEAQQAHEESMIELALKVLPKDVTWRYRREREARAARSAREWIASAGPEAEMLGRMFAHEAKEVFLEEQERERVEKTNIIGHAAYLAMPMVRAFARLLERVPDTRNGCAQKQKMDGFYMRYDGGTAMDVRMNNLMVACSIVKALPASLPPAEQMVKEMEEVFKTLAREAIKHLPPSVKYPLMALQAVGSALQKKQHNTADGFLEEEDTIALERYMVDRLQRHAISTMTDLPVDGLLESGAMDADEAHPAVLAEMYSDMRADVSKNDVEDFITKVLQPILTLAGKLLRRIMQTIFETYGGLFDGIPDEREGAGECHLVSRSGKETIFKPADLEKLSLTATYQMILEVPIVRLPRVKFKVADAWDTCLVLSYMQQAEIKAQDSLKANSGKQTKKKVGTAIAQLIHTLLATPVNAAVAIFRRLPETLESCEKDAGDIEPLSMGVSIPATLHPAMRIRAHDDISVCAISRAMKLVLEESSTEH